SADDLLERAQGEFTARNRQHDPGSNNGQRLPITRLAMKEAGRSYWECLVFNPAAGWARGADSSLAPPAAGNKVLGRRNAICAPPIAYLLPAHRWGAWAYGKRCLARLTCRPRWSG